MRVDPVAAHLVAQNALGCVEQASRACNFIFFPLQELAPRFADSLNRALVPIATAWFAPLLGAQYVVKAQKAVWPSASFV